MKKFVVIIGTVLLLSAALSGCQNTPPQQDDTAQSQIDELRSQLEDANSRIKELEEKQSEEQGPTGESASEEKTIDLELSSSDDTESSLSEHATAPTESAESVMLEIHSNGQSNVAQSASFEAKSGQTLTLEITSSIAGGSVDFFLFSPSKQEQRISITGENDVKVIKLSEGTWAYNCTGFFNSGSISIVGTIE